MGRKPGDPGSSGVRRRLWIVPLVAFILCYLGYMALSSPQRGTASISSLLAKNSEEDECCRGVDGMELWGAAVKWGTNHKFNTSKDCCLACKDMCERSDGPCLCDSWVFCGDREKCGEKFGECWLKKQKDPLLPDVKQSEENSMWTSGLIFGKGEGIIGLETEYGTLHIKLLPDCAPHSMAYIIELLGSRHCAGCQFHRAEGRGSSWDSKGNHIQDASLGPPYALIQGTLEAEGAPFEDIPIEACPSIRRGSVAWVGSGPEFFISLANHDEWQKTYTVFGSVLSDDMDIAEKIAQLPTRSERWSNIDVVVLDKPVKLKLKRTTESHGDLNLNTN